MLEVVEGLQCKLESEQDIIQLGMMNISCEAVCKAFSDELPTAVSSLIHAHTVGINMYLAQFPDWQRFMENAASIEFTQEDAETLIGVAELLSAKLRASPELAEIEVPKTFEFLRQMVTDPKGTSKRVVFALARTIENLIASVFRYGAEFIGGTAEHVSKVGQKVAAGMLIAMAIGASAQAAPAISKLSDAQWVHEATKIMQSQLEGMRNAD